MRRYLRWVLRLSLLAFVSALAWNGWFYWPYLTREPLVSAKHPLPTTRDGPASTTEWRESNFEAYFIGHTEEAIVEQFGAPTIRAEGDDAMLNSDFRRIYPDAVYAGHTMPSGELRLWYAKEKGRTVCVLAMWWHKDLTCILWDFKLK